MISIIVPTIQSVRIYFLHSAPDKKAKLYKKKWECIIVDDGSTDDTEEVVKTYISHDSRFSYYKAKLAQALQEILGLEIAKGIISLNLDSDDYTHCDKLLKSLKYLKQT
jgi:glycosyltransferase involved in cell wall biosynthesis